MATKRSATLKVAIDGEKEYKSAIAEINRENRTLGAEMKKLSAEYKGNEDSVEALTKKQSILDRQLLESTAKVEETKKQLESWRQTLEKIKKEQGATSDEYKNAAAKVQEYEAALANAETQQIKIQQSIDDTGKALENQGKITLTVGDAVNKLGQKLGINIPKEATAALNGTVSFSTGAVAALGAVAAAVTAAVKAFQWLHENTLQAAADADELLTQSLTQGVSTQTLQQWKYAEQFIDVSVSTMTSSLTKLTNSAYDAANGNDKLKDTFDKLGVSLVDNSGNLRTSEEIFYDVVDALGRVGNQTERDAIAMDILGKSAQELNPLIVQGSGALREMGAAAEEAGYALDESQIKKLAEVDDAYQEMQLQIEATKKQLAVAFAPVSKAALELVTSAVGTLTKAIEKMNDMATKASRVVKSFLGLRDEMMGYDSVGSDIAGATWKSDVGAWVSRGGTIITPENYKDFDRQTGALTREFYLGSGGGDVAAWRHMDEEQILRLLRSRNAAGDQNWRGGLTWVGESGPELVNLPRGSQIYSNQESQQIAGGDTYYNITVANVNELNEIVDWFESRRIRGRMA